MPKIKEFREGIKVIKSGMISSDVEQIVLPKSLKIIKANSIKLSNPTPDSIRYKGSFEEVKEIKIEEPNDILCIKCLDGNTFINKL